MSRGTLSADFAGSVEEARAFCEGRRFNLARRNETAGNEGMPLITVPYKNLADRLSAISLFEEHGWPEECLLDTRYGKG